MRIVLQRVSRAKVTVDNRTTGEIGPGLLALVAVGHGDDEDTCRMMAQKICGLRIFPDEQDRMNKDVRDVDGSCLAVSQFTLYADLRKGRRPYFGGAAKGDEAPRLFERFCHEVRQAGVPCETGEFAATMNVELVNDGPVTILLDSVELSRPRRASSPSCPIEAGQKK